MQVQDMDFNSLVPALQAGKIDVVISGMTPNPEREKWLISLINTMKQSK